MLVKKKNKSCLGKVCHKLKSSSFEEFFFLCLECVGGTKGTMVGCGAQEEWVQTGRATFKRKHPSPALIWGGSGGHELGCHFSAIRF